MFVIFFGEWDSVWPQQSKLKGYTTRLVYEQWDNEICLVVKEKICISVWINVWLMSGHDFRGVYSSQ